jgi:hypothetical protein
MLTVCTFLWHKEGYRSTFTPKQVNVHYAMFARNYHKPFRYVCVTNFSQGFRPEIALHPLWDDYAEVPSPHGPNAPACYRRLKLFHPETAKAIGDRILWLDLDMVILRDVTPLFDRPEPLVLLATGVPRAPYNGSMVLMDAGCRPDLWDEFSPAAGIEAKQFFNGSDQGYLSWKMRDKTPPCWHLNEQGIYARRHLKPTAVLPPDDTTLVLFMGKPDPWESAAKRRWPWLKYYYAEELREEVMEQVREDAKVARVEYVRHYRYLQANRPIPSNELRLAEKAARRAEKAAADALRDEERRHRLPHLQLNRPIRSEDIPNVD